MTGRAGPLEHAAPRCAPSAQHRGDALAGTAPRVDRWFLVEQPGPWGRDAVTGSRLPAGTGAALARATAAAGVRLQLVRRPGRDRTGGPYRWAWVDARPGRLTIRWGAAAGPGDLLGAVADPLGGVLSSEPVYLVCAHSRHDACCAVRGRAVAHALHRSRPEQVWESTHLGGCRFAAGMVALPDGLFYGHLTGDAATAVADAFEAGQVLPTGLRGCAAVDPPVQAAQVMARQAYGLGDRRALALLACTAEPGARWQVALDGGDAVVDVRVRRVAVGDPAQLTCGAGRLQRPPAYELVELGRRPR